MQAGLIEDGELDPALFAQPLNSGAQRTETIDSNALSTELQKLQRRQNSPSALTEGEKRWLDFLLALDGAAAPVANGVRSLTVTYGKHRVIGRRTASHPGMQSCPSGLRSLLLRGVHDIDIVNCHPVLKLQVAEKMDADTPKLREYVENRDPMLQRIADHYGVPTAKAKYAVIRVLNGGAIEAWIRDAGATRGQGEPQPDLRDLACEARDIQEAFFRMDEFQKHVTSLKNELQRTTAAAVEAAQSRVRAATSHRAKEAAQRQLGNARLKASRHAIDRSAFALCVFELEDKVLGVIDEYFQAHGWTVPTLIFDGMHVNHRDDADLDAAMRGAEAAVLKKLGYKIALLDKPLYTAA